MITFTIPGKPMAKGSKRLVTLRNGKPMLLDSNKKAAGWQAHVTDIAATVRQSVPLAGPVKATVTFIFSRPKAHFRTGKHSHELRPDCPVYHTCKPDADKLLRTLGDGITNAGLWRDDSQVCVWNVLKRYGVMEETQVVIQTLDTKETML